MDVTELRQMARAHYGSIAAAADASGRVSAIIDGRKLLRSADAPCQS